MLSWMVYTNNCYCGDMGLIPEPFNCNNVYADIAGVCLHLPSLE